MGGGLHIFDILESDPSIRSGHPLRYRDKYICIYAQDLF